MAFGKEDRTPAVTPWFQGRDKPMRTGVYQRQYFYGKTPSVQYCYWDGRNWSMGEHTAEQAAEHEIAFNLSPRQHLSWRGVLK